MRGARPGTVERLDSGPREELLKVAIHVDSEIGRLERVLVHDPGILILDEPAAGLDPRARIELRELLLALAGQGKAVLISSHILTELSEICHGAVILEHGRMVRAGSIRELLHAEEQHTIVRLRVLDAGDRAPAALLETVLVQPGVEDARPAGEELEVELAGGEEAAAALLAALVAAGYPIVEFRPRRGGLEEVFMSVTRGEVH